MPPCPPFKGGGYDVLRPKSELLLTLFCYFEQIKIRELPNLRWHPR